jgi:hypothetical protein
LPAGIGDEAGLLEYLDSVHRSYELSTDFAQSTPSARPLSAYRAVLLAGDERWITPQFGSALRAYVRSGGHVLSLGIGSLLRTVTINGSRALDPSQPAATDALGARPDPVVKGNTQLIGVLDDQLGIFRGTSGLYRGFTAYQPFGPVASPARIVSAAGATSTGPAIIGYRLGHGIVVDIGLPGLGSQLARNVDAGQLVSQALTVLAR